MENFLVINVLPHVAEALIKISREKIDDPIIFMADFLKHRGEEIQSFETQRTYAKFLEAVKQAEELEAQAANELSKVTRVD